MVVGLPFLYSHVVYVVLNLAAHCWLFSRKTSSDLHIQHAFATTVAINRSLM